MKEIARVEILDKTCDDCRFELAGCDRRYPNKIECNMLNDRKNWKVEQFPETFEELKELCKDLKRLCKNYIIEVFDDAIFVLSRGLVLLKVYDDGEIKDSDSEVISENRTPQQMWNIIKSLIG